MLNDFDNTSQDQQQEPASLRDTLMASMDAAMAAPTDAPADAGRVRDEHGRFAPKAEGEGAQPTAAPTQAPAGQPTQAPSAAPTAAPARAELSTWRKEMRPLQDKLATGQPLTPEEARQLAEYNVQREREYSTGISTYKAEAQQASAIRDVMQEFMPALQQAGVSPQQWIQNMGRTVAALTYGTPEQKIQTLTSIAQAYGVPLGAIQQQAQTGQVDPNITALMGQLQAVQQQVGQVTNWQQQQQQQTVQQQLAKFADQTQFPYFEQVRPVMAQLLESGAARDLDDAYAKAVRVDDSAWQAEQQRQADAKAAADQAARAAAATRARAASGSVRTGAPAGQGRAPNTDLRGALEAAFDEQSSGGRV